MQHLSFDFPADTGILVKIGEQAARSGEKAGFSDAEIGDIQLAVDEACTNTIIHGLKKDPDRMFQLEIRWETGTIEILIHETGEPFDPTATKDPDLKASLEDRPIGGLGYYFVKEVMDEIRYQVNDNGIKTLHMIKKAKDLS